MISRVVALSAAAAVCITPADADILGVSGDASLIVAPPSVDAGVLESDAAVQVFIEQDERLTASEFFVDVSEPGPVSPIGTDLYGAGALSPLDIPPGTLIESVYIHADPITPNTNFAGRVDFDREIIGLIIRPATFDASDAEAASPTTVYGTARQIGPGDTVRITGDRTSVVFAFDTGTGTDQIRVLVSADPPCNEADLAPIFGRLDLSDISAFVSAFTSGDPAGDLNEDGIFDLADIGLFIAAFTAGCP
tara:strand:- start:721 stop:1470 length:750 start_codon:yes stop_codon:yes gene_type:complete